MRFDTDTYKEIVDTLTRNKTRSFLTAFGIFWGIFMLIFLLGGGNGMQQMIAQQFSNSASNVGVIFATKTTKIYQGFGKGRYWKMTTDDITNLKRQIPGIDLVVPTLYAYDWDTQRARVKEYFTVNGTTPDFQRIDKPTLTYGRYINDMDVKDCRKVCMIGQRVYERFFPEGGDPCGKRLQIGSVFFTVIGVNNASGSLTMGSSPQWTIITPISVVRKLANRKNELDMISFLARPGVSTEAISDDLRQVIAKEHKLHPDDKKAISIYNTEVWFNIMSNTISGINFLILLVGIGTILAGAIGVSNIMMVTVRERTTEIGIRRAIGATPKMILSQILMESMALTMLAGMIGILFSVGILQLMEKAMSKMENAVTYQVDFITALAAIAFITLLGLIAGIMPAMRAMKIKPVDAMRDE